MIEVETLTADLVKCCSLDTNALEDQNQTGSVSRCQLNELSQAIDELSRRQFSQVINRDLVNEIFELINDLERIGEKSISTVNTILQRNETDLTKYRTFAELLIVRQILRDGEGLDVDQQKEIGADCIQRIKNSIQLTHPMHPNLFDERRSREDGEDASVPPRLKLSSLIQEVASVPPSASMTTATASDDNTALRTTPNSSENPNNHEDMGHLPEERSIYEKAVSQCNLNHTAESFEKDATMYRQPMMATEQQQQQQHLRLQHFNAAAIPRLNMAAIPMRTQTQESGLPYRVAPSSCSEAMTSDIATTLEQMPQRHPPHVIPNQTTAGQTNNWIHYIPQANPIRPNRIPPRHPSCVLQPREVVQRNLQMSEPLNPTKVMKPHELAQVWTPYPNALQNISAFPAPTELPLLSYPMQHNMLASNLPQINPRRYLQSTSANLAAHRHMQHVALHQNNMQQMLLQRQQFAQEEMFDQYQHGLPINENRRHCPQESSSEEAVGRRQTSRPKLLDSIKKRFRVCL